MEVLWKGADDNDIDGDNLPRDKDNLVNLTDLYLSDQSGYGDKLTELPKEIGNLVNLTGLWIGSNQLTKLPKEIGNLVNLKGLLIGNNQLTDLPKEVTNLVLSELNLSHNRLNVVHRASEEQLEWMEQIKDVLE